MTIPITALEFIIYISLVIGAMIPIVLLALFFLDLKNRKIW